jgi:hypothetical protein
MIVLRNKMKALHAACKQRARAQGHSAIPLHVRRRGCLRPGSRESR